MEKRIQSIPKGREVMFRDMVTDVICKIVVSDDGWAWYNGRYYANYKNARARLGKNAKGPLIRIQ